MVPFYGRESCRNKYPQIAFTATSSWIQCAPDVSLTQDRLKAKSLLMDDTPSPGAACSREWEEANVAECIS